MLASVSFPIYTRALVNAVLRREQRWHVTGSAGRRASPFNFMIPQVLFFVFLLLTSVVGVWRDLGAGNLSLALAWNVTNTLILGAFMVTALREARTTRRAERRRRRSAVLVRGRRRSPDQARKRTAPTRTIEPNHSTRAARQPPAGAARTAQPAVAADERLSDLITTGGTR